MPTAPKLIAALLFAGLAWLVSAMAIPRIDHPVDPVLMPLGCASVGLLLGWTLMGRRAGEGALAAAAHGVTTALVVAAASILLWSVWRMLVRATRLRYDGPGEALSDTLVLALDNTRLLWHAPTALTMLAGAVAIGLLVDRLARVWS